jgi:hypothetical protein
MKFITRSWRRWSIRTTLLLTGGALALLIGYASAVYAKPSGRNVGRSCALVAAGGRFSPSAAPDSSSGIRPRFRPRGHEATSVPSGAWWKVKDPTGPYDLSDVPNPTSLGAVGYSPFPSTAP